MDLKDAATVHQLALQAEGRSLATQRRALTYQRRFLEYLDARQLPPALDQLNALNARQAVLWFQQRKVGARGGVVATAAFLEVLKTWAGFLEREGVFENSPLRRVKRVSVRRLERQPYTPTEVGAMLHACESSRQPERDRLLILLLLDTGARISEITGLHTGDVRTDTRTIRVLGKFNRERTIPFGKPDSPDGGPIFRALRAYLKVRERMVERNPQRAGDRLLLTLAAWPLSPEGGTNVIKRLGAAAGVAGAIPHRFRHTAASHYLTIFPGDEVGLRRLLGHVGPDSMRDYVHLSQTTISQRAGRASLSDSFLRGAR